MWPLWDAITTSFILGTANLIGLANLLLHKSELYVPTEHRDIYHNQFSHMPPADFSHLDADLPARAFGQPAPSDSRRRAR